MSLRLQSWPCHCEYLARPSVASALRFAFLVTLNFTLVLLLSPKVAISLVFNTVKAIFSALGTLSDVLRRMEYYHGHAGTQFVTCKHPGARSADKMLGLGGGEDDYVHSTTV